MGTSQDEVVDLFLSLVQDYRLNTLFVTSGSAAFGTYVEPWTLLAINDFSPICVDDLTYASGSFVQTLSMESKLILAQLMVKYWLMKNVQDILGMNLALQDHDYHTYSQSQGLQAKQSYLNAKKEELSQLLNDYSFRHKSDWNQWFNQIFSP